LLFVVPDKTNTKVGKHMFSIRLTKAERDRLKRAGEKTDKILWKILKLLKEK